VSVACGTWNDQTRTFTPVAACTDAGANAVHILAWRRTDPLVRPFAPARRSLSTTATAWIAPVVQQTSCVKPWALPYASLAEALGKLADADLTSADVNGLLTMNRKQRQFSLTLGDGNKPLSSADYYAVSLPGSLGADDYRDNLAQCNPAMIAPGDTLLAQPGRSVGPTLQGAASLCVNLVDGACLDRAGAQGVPIKVPLWVRSVGASGRRGVIVKTIGSFMLTRIEQRPANESQITGYFLPIIDGGRVGACCSTLVRPVLVQ
jgi:hypothetical protein